MPHQFDVSLDSTNTQEGISTTSPEGSSADLRRVNICQGEITGGSEPGHNVIWVYLEELVASVVLGGKMAASIKGVLQWETVIQGLDENGGKD